MAQVATRMDNEVKEFLARLQLSHFVDAFEAEEFTTMEHVRLITMDDLRGMDIKRGPARKLLAALPSGSAGRVARLGRAHYELAKCYEKGTGGVDKDDVMAVQMYQYAADEGHAGARFELARCCESGMGMKAKDSQKAVVLLEQAAMQGHALAQNNLGVCYEVGINGVEIDGAKAVWWYSKAAERGLAQAQYNLGTCHRDGVGRLSRSLATAQVWFKLAAAQGHEAAQQAIVC
jgi:hypothetical protein